MLKTLGRLSSLDSNRSFLDAISLAINLIPIRYVTATTDSLVSEGSIYGVESAEDTSEAGQRINPHQKAVLLDLIPSYLDQFESLLNSNLDDILQRLDKRNTLLSGLFLLAHSVASFRQSFEDSEEPEESVPQPPSLQPVPRPKIKVDQALQPLLETSMTRICSIVERCGYTSVALLWWWENASSATIRSKSAIPKEEFSSNIEVPEVSPEEHNFDATGIAACLLEFMLAQESIPTQWLIYHPSVVLERLLPHAKTLTLSRSSGGPLFVRVILSYHPETMLYDISYPLDYILENEILPAKIAQKAYYAIRACIEFAIRMPDTRLRQHTFAALSALVNLFDVNSQFKLLYLLAKTCPYPSAQSAIVHLMKEAFLKQHAEAILENSKNESSKMQVDAKPSTAHYSLLSDELFLHYFAKEALKVPGLEQRFDSVIAALNFLRAILLRDAKSRLSSIWKSPASISHFKQQVIAPLTSAVLQIIAQHQRDDSYHDRQRIQKELSSKGAGTLSIDQLQESQSQSILNWQLAHSILLRIEELVN